MKTNILWAGLILACACFCGGCSDDKEDGIPSGENVREARVEATDYESWTYFSFKTGESFTLPIGKVEGGVTGMFFGTLALEPLMGMPLGSQENLTVFVNRITEDSVEVTLKDLTFAMPNVSGGMPGKAAAGEIQPYTLTTRARATKEGDRWVIAGAKTENEVTGGEVPYYTLKVDGFIGATLDSDIELACEITPGKMPFALKGTYTAKNTEREIKEITYNGLTGKYVPGTSFETDPAAEREQEWDIAFHKYDVRTNGGRVARMETTRWKDVTDVPVPAYFKADGRGMVIASMDEMLPYGKMGFMCTPLNDALGSFVTATPTGNMPPFKYNLNKNIFVVRTASGKAWKVQFSDYTERGKSVVAKFFYEEMEDTLYTE